MLKSLKGLENIDPAFVENFYLRGNFSLSDCSYENICKVVLVNLQLADVQQNAYNCSSLQEILSFCKTTTEDYNTSLVKIYPNPTLGIIYLTFDTATNNNDVIYTIFNSNGKKVDSGALLYNTVDISSLLNGFYILDIGVAGQHYQSNVALIK